MTSTNQENNFSIWYLDKYPREFKWYITGAMDIKMRGDICTKTIKWSDLLWFLYSKWKVYYWIQPLEKQWLYWPTLDSRIKQRETHKEKLKDQWITKDIECKECKQIKPYKQIILKTWLCRVCNYKGKYYQKQPSAWNYMANKKSLKKKILKMVWL